MKGPNWDRLFLSITSVILALLLWLQVSTQSDPATQREFAVPLKLENAPENMAPTRFPPAVTAVAEGPTRELNNIDIGEWQASIDLSNAAPGTSRLPVRLIGPTRTSIRVTLKRPSEIVQIARVRRVEHLVEIEERGRRPEDLQYDGAVTQPETVTVVGPETVVPGGIGRVRALLDLSKIRPGVSFNVDVEVLGKGNLPVPLARCEPATVTVYPAVAAAPTTNNVLITPVWKGQPAFGYEVQRYELKPSQVTLTGKSAVLASLQKVETEPIDLTGIRETTLLSTRLRLPTGVQAMGGATVRVTVFVAKSQPVAEPKASEAPAP